MPAFAAMRFSGLAISLDAATSSTGYALPPQSLLESAILTRSYAATPNRPPATSRCFSAGWRRVRRTCDSTGSAAAAPVVARRCKIEQTRHGGSVSRNARIVSLVVLGAMSLCAAGRVGAAVSENLTQTPRDGWSAQLRPEERAYVERARAAAAPGAEHALLAEMAGVWNCTMTVWREPADPEVAPVETKAMVVREMTIGGRVLDETVTANRMGQPFVARRILGFDNAKKQYWAAATNNMSTKLEIESGKLTAAGHIEFTAQFDDPSAGRTPTRTVYARPGGGKQLIESYQTLKGTEYRFIRTVCEKGM